MYDFDAENWFDIAQICLNGHVVNDTTRDAPTRNQPFCERCGAETIMACQKCSAEIRGFEHIGGVVHSEYDRPAYCLQCGAPFPWTEAGLQAARDLADVLEGLTPEDRAQLKESLEHLVKDTPQARVAETRLKQILKRSGKEAVDGMRSVLTDILSETVRKAIFGA